MSASDLCRLSKLFAHMALFFYFAFATFLMLLDGNAFKVDNTGYRFKFKWFGHEDQNTMSYKLKNIPKEQ